MKLEDCFLGRDLRFLNGGCQFLLNSTFTNYASVRFGTGSQMFRRTNVYFVLPVIGAVPVFLKSAVQSSKYSSVSK